MTGEPQRTRARSYRDLVVWQKSMALARTVYQLSASWPSDERFGLISQVRRASVSIPANLAEGQGRIGTKEFTRFVAIAHGSLCELETELLLAEELGFSDPSEFSACKALMEEIGRMCRSLIYSGDSRLSKGNS
jgi:four helix bundle protein